MHIIRLEDDKQEGSKEDDEEAQLTQELGSANAIQNLEPLPANAFKSHA